MDLVFKGINCTAGAILLLQGLGGLFAGFFGLFRGSFFLLFGVAVLNLELTDRYVEQTRRYGSFLFSFLGRGGFYVFMSSLVISRNVGISHDATSMSLTRQAIPIVLGVLMMLAGALYIGLAFVPSIEPPR